MADPRRTPRGIEWPTLGLLVLCYGLWALATTWVAAWFLPVGIALTMVAVALHSSLSHEVIHGHPFGSERVNAALEPVPGVERMLADLRERYRLGLLTNGPVVAQRSKLDALGWVDAFDVTLVTGELAAGKPEPAAFESLLDELDTDAPETVFVGNDVTADVGGAVAAGIGAVQVCYPGGPSRDPDAFAHVDRDDLATELPRVLAER